MARKTFTRIQKADAITLFCKKNGLLRPKYLNGHSDPKVGSGVVRQKAMSVEQIDDYIKMLKIDDDFIYESRRHQGLKKYNKSLAIYKMSSID